MKKAAIAAMALLLSVLFWMEAAADTVTRGDSLWKIAQKHLGITWQEIARENKISGPKYIIYPGQELMIPELKTSLHKERLWKNVGGDPYRGTLAWAIDNFGLPDEIKSRVRENIAQDKYQWFPLGHSQELSQITFGKNKIWDKVLTAWEPTQMYAAKDYGADEYHVIMILKCRNWAWWKEEAPRAEPLLTPSPPSELVIKEAPRTEPPILSISFPPVPVFEVRDELPPVPIFEAQKEKAEICDRCGFDFYIGGGIYETDRWLNSDNKDYHADGWYLWGKARYRPFGFNITEDISACLGAFIFGAIGGGDDEDYDYSWRKWAIGPSLGLIGRHWDADIDVGLWGRLISEGETGLYESKQTDNIFLFSSHLNLYSRRDQGEKWFPKTEFSLELTLPYDEKHKHSWNGSALEPNPYDNQVLELSLIQHIYDYRINDHLLLTPGFNLGYAHESGRDDPNFVQFGPRVTMAWHNEDIISISVLNYKENLEGDGDQWHWLSGYLSIGGLIKAYRSSQITEATAEDLAP